MDNLKLINDLKKCCKHLDKKYNVNNGGCLYLAYYIAKYLEKFAIDYNVAIYNERDFSFDHISLIVDNKEINKLPKNCYVFKKVRYPGYIYNSKAMFSLYKALKKYANDDYKIYHNKDVRKEINEIFKAYQK